MADGVKGLVYRCPVCGAEIAVLADAFSSFVPRCCNTLMVPVWQRLSFFVCPVCGVEIAVLNPTHGDFTPRCCNTDMLPA